MSDYEGQEQKDTEAYYDDQWFKNMEYLEEWDDLEEEEEWDEEVNRQLDILDQDRMARENGEKPAAEWERADFKDLLHQYPRLRHWRTRELRAVFLDYMEYIDGVEYYKRDSMEETRQRMSEGIFFIDLATPAPIDKDSDYAFYRWAAEDMKVWKLWRSLGETR